MTDRTRLKAIEKIAQYQGTLGGYTPGGPTRIQYNGRWYNSVDEIPTRGPDDSKKGRFGTYGSIVGSAPRRGAPSRQSGTNRPAGSGGPYGNGSIKSFGGGYLGGSRGRIGGSGIKSFGGGYFR